MRTLDEETNQLTYAESFDLCVPSTSPPARRPTPLCPMPPPRVVVTFPTAPRRRAAASLRIHRSYPSIVSI